MKKAVVSLLVLLCLLPLVGCTRQVSVHEPVRVLSCGIDYEPFKAVLKEKYPEVELEVIGWNGQDKAGYCQYTLENGDIPDIYTAFGFGCPEADQRAYLMNLNKCAFIENYNPEMLSYAALGEDLYLVPVGVRVTGMCYNKSLFEDMGWTVPQDLESLSALCGQIQQEGLIALDAQLCEPRRAFQLLLALAQTGSLGSEAGKAWQKAFLAGDVPAQEGFGDGTALLSYFKENRLITQNDLTRTHAESEDLFVKRRTAISFWPVTPSVKTGDAYALMPYFGADGSHVYLVSPLRCYGLSAAFEKPENAQKRADALKVLEVLSSPEGQKAIIGASANTVSSLKEDPHKEHQQIRALLDTEPCVFYAVDDYTAMSTPVGSVICAYLSGTAPAEAVCAEMDAWHAARRLEKQSALTAARDFTETESARLSARAFKEAAGTDFGLVSLNRYADGVENPAGASGKIYQGALTTDNLLMTAPLNSEDYLHVITASGAELTEMMETGFIPDPENPDRVFDYVLAGGALRRDGRGRPFVFFDDGTVVDDNKTYTIATNAHNWSERTARRTMQRETGMRAADVICDYAEKNTFLKP